MTAADFRRIALGMADAIEGAHMGHPDFRVHGRIFASLDATQTSASLVLPPEHQQRFIDSDGDAFVPASGAWGRQGWTRVRLAAVDDEDALGEAITLAWQLIAAKGSTSNARKRGVAAKTSPVDALIAASPVDAREILQKIRALVRKEAPDAEEKVSYRMPAFFQDGALIYYAAFKDHIGVFPPVKGDATLLKALAPYRGPKGNLAFPLGETMPYALIRRVVKARLAENRARAVARRRKAKA